jgi:hypothetical protein
MAINMVKRLILQNWLKLRTALDALLAVAWLIVYSDQISRRFRD